MDIDATGDIVCDLVIRVKDWRDISSCAVTKWPATIGQGCLVNIFLDALSFGMTMWLGKKDRSFFAPRTNLGVCLLGQPRALHEGFAAVMTKQSRMRGLGLEHRFVYLFADDEEEMQEDLEEVSFCPALDYLRGLWATRLFWIEARYLLICAFSRRGFIRKLDLGLDSL